MAALLFAALSAGTAHAQCRDGDFLVGEDDRYWYCAEPASPETVESVVKDLDKLAGDGPQQLLGKEWRYRKAVIDAAGCVARNGWQYHYGGRITIPEECLGQRDLGVDCSGFVAYAGRFAACAIDGFYRAAFNTLKGLETDAAGQAEMFRRQHAFIPAGGRPSPGDLIFFAATYDRNGDKKVDDADGVTHVGIYLGRRQDGAVLMIHASSRAKRVIITPMPTQLGAKVFGYGNMSRLYMNLNSP